MKISIAMRLHPFSHLPGAKSLLPGSHLTVQVFPTRICFFRGSTLVHTALLDVCGPVEGFTVELDLERQHIAVFGKAARGYFRYVLKRHADGVLLLLDRGSLSCDSHTLRGKDTYLFPIAFSEAWVPSHEERLSLGAHKSQDWERIKRRSDCMEIFPSWLCLGQMTPSAPLEDVGNFALLYACERMIRERRTEEILSAFTSFFLAAFEGICVPRLHDTDYQGIIPAGKELSDDPSPIALLTQGAVLIRSLFFKEEGNTLFLLPCLPPSFHCGRMRRVRTTHGHLLDFEWSKKALRRVLLTPSDEGELLFQLPRSITACRVRTSLRDKGRKHLITDGKLSLHVKRGTALLIDRLHK